MTAPSRKPQEFRKRLECMGIRNHSITRTDMALTARAMVPLRSVLPTVLAHQLQRPRNVAASAL